MNAVVVAPVAETPGTGRWMIAVPIPEAPELIQRALARFKDYAAARDLTLPRSWASLEQMSDPGRVADIICTHVVAPLPARQELLATLDPVARLEKVDAMIAASL